jgi:hypothetical protein
MGFQYGTLLKEHLELMVLISDALFPKKTLDKYKKIAAVAEVNLPESFRQELKGMVDASGIDYNLFTRVEYHPFCRLQRVCRVGQCNCRWPFNYGP